MAPSTRRSLDAYGDPLPRGAVRRLGTERLDVRDLIRSLAVSGERCAVGGDSGAIYIFDSKTGERLRVLRCKRVGRERNAVEALRFSPDGALLASVNAGTVRLWEVESGRERLAQKVGRWGHVPIAFSPDGAELASSGDEGVVRWSSAGKELARWRSGGGLKAIALDAQGRLAGLGDTEAFLFSPTGKKLRTSKMGDPKHHRAHPVVGFASDGRLVAATVLGVYAWDAKGNLLGHHPWPKGWEPAESGLALLDGAVLAARGRVRWREAGSGQDMPTRMPAADAVAISPDGRTALLAGDGLRLWDVQARKEKLTFPRHDGVIQALRFSPDGAWLWSAGSDSTIRRWNPSTGALVETLKGWTYALDRKGSRAATNGSQGLHVQALARGAPRVKLESRGKYRSANDFSPDGKLLAGAEDGTVVLWNAATGKVRRRLGSHATSRATHVSSTFSPDGRLLASCGWDGALHLWEVASGKRLRTLGQPRTRPDRVDFSPDGKHLAACARDGKVIIWEVATGKKVRAWSVDSQASSTRYSPDGSLLATSGVTVVQLWTARGKLLATLEALRSPLAFSPDGKWLATSLRSIVLIWEVAAL